MSLNLTKSPYLQNPAKKEVSWNFLDKVRGIGGKVKEGVSNVLKFSNPIAPNVYGKVKNTKPNPFEIVYKKTRNTAKKVFRENFTDPFPLEYTNKARWLAFGDRVEKDFKTAQNRGGLLMGRTLGAFSFMNYPRTWLSNAFKYISPEWLQRKVHKSTVRRTETLWKPWDFIKTKTANSFRTIVKPFKPLFPKKMWKYWSEAPEKTKKSALEIIRNAENKVTITDVEENLFPKRKKETFFDYYDNAA